MKITGVIPARLGSTRLQEKVLKIIGGKPMIQRVWERAKMAKKLGDLIVACDDKRIADVIEAAGGKAMMTRVDHPNGSSRVAEIVSKTDAEVYINIQGDEPMIDPGVIDRLADAFSDPSVQVATLAVRKHDAAEYENPNVVKLVTDSKNDALYFSRSPLPYYREKPAQISFLKHLGIYGYRREFLLQFVTWGAGVLEDTEKLEQLRILEKGYRIRVIEVQHDSVSVDTAEDLAVVEAKISHSLRTKEGLE